MRICLIAALSLLVLFPITGYTGVSVTQSWVQMETTDFADEELFAYYDLRNRQTFIQITNDETEDEDALPTLCIHVQIYQQDKNCDELNFEDELTPNDTVVYDMDNLVRNDGSPLPINLDNDSYGFVSVSAYECGDTGNDDVANDEYAGPLLGNFRIIDDSGYEYRMNMVSEPGSQNDNNTVLPPSFNNPPEAAEAAVIIPFNTVDGANQADIVGFIVQENRNLAGIDDDNSDHLVYNDEGGITFSVFLLDENEERLSCDQKNFACGPDKVMNYGVNEDFPASRGNNLLCEGAGLLPGQTHGYISLENPTFLSQADANEEAMNDEQLADLGAFEFICMVGINNGDGTGSMDECQFRCLDDDECSPGFEF